MQNAYPFKHQEASLKKTNYLPFISFMNRLQSSITQFLNQTYFIYNSEQHTCTCLLFIKMTKNIQNTELLEMCSNHKDAINSNEHLRAVRAYHAKLHEATCFQHNIQVNLSASHVGSDRKQHNTAADQPSATGMLYILYFSPKMLTLLWKCHVKSQLIPGFRAPQQSGNQPQQPAAPALKHLR